MHFKVVAAVCKGRGIGKDNKLPWNIKEDLAYFSKLTKGHGNNALIMGRKTWESVGSKPLRGRANLILSRTMEAGKKDNEDHVEAFPDLDSLLVFCRRARYDDIWIIGGESIYRQFLDKELVSLCSITFVNEEHDCDTHFPKLDSTWSLRYAEKLETKGNKDVEIRQLVRGSSSNALSLGV